MLLHMKFPPSTKQNLHSISYVDDEHWDNNKNPPHNKKICAINSPWTQAKIDQQHTSETTYILN